MSAATGKEVEPVLGGGHVFFTSVVVRAELASTIKNTGVGKCVHEFGAGLDEAVGVHAAFEYFEVTCPSGLTARSW